MIEMAASPQCPVRLGHTGENEAVRVAFALDAFEKAFPGGRPALLVKRTGDLYAYPVELTVEDMQAYWTVTRADTAKAGYGQCELQWYVGEALAKSDCFEFVVEQALEGGEQPPEPLKLYLEKLVEDTDAAKLETYAAAEAARASAQTAEEILASNQAVAVKTPQLGENGNWMVWDAQAGAYQDSGKQAKGEKGDTGATGAKGEKGDAFTYADFTPEQLAALRGAKGDKGDTGATGAAGAKGEKGDKGDTGATGAKGEKGDAFTYADFTPEQLAALRGAKGDKGDTGATGATGAKGEKGDKGDTGATGAKGEKGEKGDAFTYADFTPEQLAALRGAKGDKGDTGATGAAGAKGDKGDKGDTGATGAKGDTPVKGTDYFTEADKAELVNDVLAALPNGDTEVYGA